MLNDHDDPTGVLVATSNAPGRFDLANTKVLRNAALIIARIINNRGLINRSRDAQIQIDNECLGTICKRV